MKLRKINEIVKMFSIGGMVLSIILAIVFSNSLMKFFLSITAISVILFTITSFSNLALDRLEKLKEKE